ncbi:acyl-CoA dehydrogenase [Anaerosporomusa subterranea]|uniref:Acyl-CoA dehydrogenase n=1 Tax=Anaerosporomusa subterranea TaxID=1794912 RepID=A0A154BP11_ANASB|nr:acyl-CoA dehydrogenase family protein [Anaerosporomusa subterranea]KYZ75676.1 acyl-CoA dehydrogenase [Anaerosporomusa subterranea]
MFNMSFSDEQKDLQKLVREFTQKRIFPEAKELDRAGEFAGELFKEIVEMGLHCMNAPQEYDGPGFDSVTCVMLTEELAKGDVGFATTVAANGLAAYPVLLAGTAEQKKLFFDIINQGKLAAFCLTEPNAGSDAGSVATIARREGDEYILDGTKCFITNGGVADVYTVFATVDRSKGLKGLSAFLVERGRAGVSVGKEEDKMGIRTSNTTEVIFQNVRIPASNLLGKEGNGFKIAMETLDISRPVVGALGVGLGQAAVEMSAKYAIERSQFGKPIGSFQAIQFMLADMAIQVEAARWLTYRAAYLRDAGQPFTKEAAMAKTLASDVAMKVSVDAVQIFGGYGYSREYPVEKLMRDAKILQLFEGTNQVQRMVIAGQLLK